MVCRQLEQLTVTLAVQPTVTAIHRVDLSIIIGQSYERRAHTLVLFIGPTFRINIVIDRIEPANYSLVKIACTEIGWNIMEVIA